MNRKFLIVGSFIVSVLLLGSCGDQEEVTNEEPLEKVVSVADEGCLYTYNAKSSSLNWVAFKTSDRVAVGGSFDSLKVMLSESVFSPMQAMENASFEVYVNSVFTDNSIRDNTLRKYFFSALIGGDVIKGKFKIVEGDDNAGGGSITLQLNNVTRDVGFEYTVDASVITIKTRIDLISFQGDQAINSLNKECDELHRGADGVSKLWPDIEIEVIVALDKKC